MRLTQRGEHLVTLLLWTCISLVAGVAVFLTLLVVTPTPAAPQEVIPTSHSSQQGR